MMRKIMMLSGICVFALSGAFISIDADARHFRKKNKTDFALFDATNPANLEPGAVCYVVQFPQPGRPWNFHVAVTNNDPTNTQAFKVVYKDGDWVQYYVPPRSSFALTQSAGNNAGGVAIRVFTTPSAQLSGAVSGQGIDGTRVVCKSCDNDSDGPAACDAVIPFP